MRSNRWYPQCPAGAVGVAAWLVVTSALVAPAPSAAQTWELGLGAAFFIDLPEPFQDNFCETSAGGLAGSAAWHGLDWVAVEGSVTMASERGATMCAFADLAPIPLDTPFDETTFDPRIRGASFFATHVSAVLEPLRQSAVSPRARLGAGRTWGKQLNDWVWGLGVRYRFGRHSLVMDVDRWKLDIPENRERVIYRSVGGREVLSSREVTRSYTPTQFRVGWELSVGRQPSRSGM